MLQIHNVNNYLISAHNRQGDWVAECFSLDDCYSSSCWFDPVAATCWSYSLVDRKSGDGLEMPLEHEFEVILYHTSFDIFRPRWAFSPLTKDSLLTALQRAVLTCREHKTSWEGVMKRGMEKNMSWDNAAVQYEQVFDWAFIDPPYAG
ncbi:hypothetical protein SASPL_149302 [Salvia splendens]|uniref:Uncharacterized protein n=1 Tax=Salvia splendens TaxID=180675 RepID=A0A8X8WCK4_SALSN|nr:hypothetical protein SASPL_149302 [Salvia splendens]